MDLSSNLVINKFSHDNFFLPLLYIFYALLGHYTNCCSKINVHNLLILITYVLKSLISIIDSH